jgi:hypothetical protein
MLFISLRSLRHRENLRKRFRFGTWPGVNISRNTTVLTDLFRGLPQSLQANAGIVSQIRQLSSILFQNCSSLILPELLIFSLIKPLSVQPSCFMSSVSAAYVLLSSSAYPASLAFRI